MYRSLYRLFFNHCPAFAQLTDKLYDSPECSEDNGGSIVSRCFQLQLHFCNLLDGLTIFAGVPWTISWQNHDIDTGNSVAWVHRHQLVSQAEILKFRKTSLIIWKQNARPHARTLWILPTPYSHRAVNITIFVDRICPYEIYCCQHE